MNSIYNDIHISDISEQYPSYYNGPLTSGKIFGFRPMARDSEAILRYSPVLKKEITVFYLILYGKGHMFVISTNLLTVLISTDYSVFYKLSEYVQIVVGSSSPPSPDAASTELLVLLGRKFACNERLWYIMKCLLNF